MAKPNMSFDASGLREIDTGPGIMQDLKLEQVNLDAKHVDSDVVSSMNDIFKDAKERQASSAQTIELKDFDISAGLADLDASAGLSKIQKLLQKAIALIDGKAYEEALKVLARILQEEPNHHEALYLRALCCANTRDDLEALRCLVPLRGARLEPKLQTRVDSLKLKIRDRMLLGFILDAVMRKAIGVAQSISRLQELVKLDPDTGIYHFMLTVKLMNAGKMEQARKAISYGLQEATTPDRDRLDLLQKHLDREYIKYLLIPAIKSFKKGDYRRTRSQLSRIDRSYQQSPLFQVFSNYLKKLEGGFLSRRKSMGQAAPSGKPKDVDAFYFLLVAEELSEAKELLGKKEMDNAEKILRAALRYAPAFPYLNFLYAVCLYQRLGIQINRKNPPKLEIVIGTLQQAMDHAGIAAQDKEIAQASSLRQAIKNLLDTFHSIEKEVELKRQEAKYVNEAIAEFKAIMDRAGKGISSKKQYDDVHKRLKKLRDNLPKVNKRVKSREGKKAMEALGTAVERNWKQLASIADSMSSADEDRSTVEKNVNLFNMLMKSLEDGIKSRDQLITMHNAFKTMRDLVEADRTKVRSPEANKVLDDVLGAINKVLSQFESAR